MSRHYLFLDTNSMTRIKQKHVHFENGIDVSEDKNNAIYRISDTDLK